MKRLFYFLIFCVIASSAHAQTDNNGKQKLQAKLSINYNSALHYYGRTDSLRSSGFFPMGELWFGKKVYVSAAPIFISNQSVSFDYAGSVATLGYLNVAPKAITHIYVLKPFYEQGSQLVQSALKAQSGALVSLRSKVVNLSLGGDVKWSNQLDYGAQAGLDHTVRLQKGQSVFVINPTFTASAGTQSFMRTYTQKAGGLFPREQTVTESSKQFRILAYEFSMPLIWAKNKIQLTATPAYVAPQNLQSEPQNMETGEPMFYTTLSARYSF